MRGDFSRFTFNPQKHYRSVYMQQGRVQLDADWNEQIDILNYYRETQLKDLLGPSGALNETAGFHITMSGEPANTNHPEQQTQHAKAGDEHEDRLPFDLHISKGHYYVDGILCENEQDVLFIAQPDYPQPTITGKLKEYALVYLDTWQRHITAFEDPTLYETALNGIDTTTRAKTIWQVKILPVGDHHVLADSSNVTYEEIVSLSEWHEILNRQQRKAQLTAKCVPHSRALNNQLYRVEIHEVQDNKAVFKWSRDNGAVVFCVELVQQGEKDENGMVQVVVTPDDLGRDTALLQEGDWVEIVDNDMLLNGRTLPLYRVTHIPDSTNQNITLTGQFSDDLKSLQQQKSQNLLLRRWDHDTTNRDAPGYFTIHENTPFNLEGGIQIIFSASGIYDVGDYWLIPSRMLINNIDWPSEPANKQVPLAQPPHGNYHHYCPLALLHHHKGTWRVAKDLRRLFSPLPVISALAQKPEPPKIEVTEIVDVLPDLKPQMSALFEECLSEESLAPGDLVSFVPGRKLHVVKANRDNAQLLFGVVSSVKEKDGERRFQVTIYGRTHCKVAETVEAGDLLTVSEKDGCATKTGAAHRLFSPGTILGKSLETYKPVDDDDDTIGMIEVMVTLL